MTLVVEVDLEKEIDALSDDDWVHEYLRGLNDCLNEKHVDLGRWKQ